MIGAILIEGKGWLGYFQEKNIGHRGWITHTVKRFCGKRMEAIDLAVEEASDDQAQITDRLKFVTIGQPVL